MNENKKRRKEPVIWKTREVVKVSDGRLYPLKLPKIIIKRPEKPQLVSPGLLLKKWLLGNRFELTEEEKQELRRLVENE